MHNQMKGFKISKVGFTKRNRVEIQPLLQICNNINKKT